MSKDRNERLFKNGFIDFKTLEELDSELADEIAKERSMRNESMKECLIIISDLEAGISL